VVENAHLFSLPAEPPRIFWAASGTNSAELAGVHGDGLWATSPSRETVDAYRNAGGDGDVIGQITICFGRDREKALDTALEIWPNAGVPGQLSQDLPTYVHFEQASQLVTREVIADQVPCGDDVDAVVETATQFAEAGFTMLHVHQIGPDQQGFLDWWQSEVAEAVRDVDAVSSRR
jgi:G6PDH family F420-dependent oxidoreductase